MLDEIVKPRVFLSKFADFGDNLLSLHHSQNPSMTKELATKYLPLVEHFRARLKQPDLAALVGAAGLAAMRTHLEGNRLTEFATA